MTNKERILLKKEIVTRLSKKEIERVFKIDTKIKQVKVAEMFKPKYRNTYYHIYIIVAMEEENIVIYSYNTYLQTIHYIVTIFQ